MKPIKAIICLICVLCIWAWPAQAKIVGKDVEYRSGKTTLNGYLAYDDAMEGQRPGVIVVHEWWGQNAYARKRADMLAGLGYVAFAIDMYGEGKVTDHPDKAAEFAQEVYANLDNASARFQAGMDVLKNFPLTEKDKIAAIGYCFGGGVILHMARAGMDLDAVASFHGSLATKTPAEPGAVKAKILVLTGADDSMVPSKAVKAFEEEMTAAQAEYEVIVYPGAKHSFTNPEADKFAEEYDLPVGYNKEADMSSWEEMKHFLNLAFEE